MPRCELDHLVVAAGAREEGVAWVEEVLGVTLQVGGEHPRMGTHNSLLRLGDEQYLEVISINPAAPPPGRSRWFDLDSAPGRFGPALATWVARGDDVAALARSCPVALGGIESTSRGSFEWLITVRSDGSLPGGGLVPSLIQWRTQSRPPALLADQGCRLRRLEGFHSDWAALLPAINALGLESQIEPMPLPRGEQPYLVAHIETSLGVAMLGGPRASA